MISGCTGVGGTKVLLWLFDAAIFTSNVAFVLVFLLNPDQLLEFALAPKLGINQLNLFYLDVATPVVDLLDSGFDLNLKHSRYDI